MESMTASVGEPRENQEVLNANAAYRSLKSVKSETVPLVEKH
jgi:hypothetical protein